MLLCRIKAIANSRSCLEQGIFVPQNNMIHPERLSNYIMSRESKNTQDRLVVFYDSLTVEQRQEIKEMFIRNKELK